MNASETVVAVRTVSSTRSGRENVLTLEFDKRMLDTGGGHIVIRGEDMYDREDEYSDLLANILHELFDHSTDVQSVKIMLVEVSKAQLFIHYSGPENSDEMLGRITKAANGLMMLIDR